MKKCDLRSGMFVRLADNGFLVVVGEVLLSSDGYTIDLRQYNERLFSTKRASLDIVAVYPVIGEGVFGRCNWHSGDMGDAPIWERRYIEGFQIVWAWDDDQVAARKIGVHDSTNKCIFNDFGEADTSCTYDNYEPLGGGDILPWMERMKDVCRRNNSPDVG